MKFSMRSARTLRPRALPAGRRPFFSFAPLCGALLLAALAAGCASAPRTRLIETTAYTSSCEENGWTRGNWYFLWLDFWNRYDAQTGAPVTADTASGADFQLPHPGLFSVDTLAHPWMLPVRLVFPWLWLPARGTIAADTDYYPFGTEMNVPGWGAGVVTDRGRAIKGPDRLDLLFYWSSSADDWGRRRVDVEIESMPNPPRRALPPQSGATGSGEAGYRNAQPAAPGDNSQPLPE